MSRALDMAKGAGKTAFSHYAEIVMSIVPCIVVASLVGAVINIMGEMPLVQGRTLTEVYTGLRPWYELLAMISDCGMQMLPVYVAWATVRHFKGTETYGIFVGLALVPADYLNGLSLSTAIANGTAEHLSFGCLTIPRAGFQGQMFIAILAGGLSVCVERALTKRVPRQLHIFVVPLCCVVSAVLGAYLLVGPVLRAFEQALAAGCLYLLTEAPFRYLSGFFLGLCHLPLMLFGLHLAFVPTNLQLVMSGSGTPLWPITVTSVLAAGGAALAMLLFSPDRSLREAAREGSLVTLGLGMVEPALFGVCTRSRAAMLGAMLSAAVSGMLCRILDCSATLFGLNGFLSFLSMPLEKWGVYAFALATSIVLGMLLTMLFLKISARKA